MNKNDYIEFETTMSELLLLFYSTKDGIDSFRAIVGENWEEELIRFRGILNHNIQSGRSNNNMIVRVKVRSDE